MGSFVNLLLLIAVSTQTDLHEVSHDVDGGIPPSDVVNRLGAQRKDAHTLVPLKPDRHKVLALYAISLSVVRGSQLNLLKSANALVTYDGKRFQRVPVDRFRPVKDAYYLYGHFRLKEQRGYRFYQLDVRIAEGPLQGRIVHLCDGKLQESVRDPCQAVFEVPERWGLREGPTQIDIVHYVVK